MLLITKLVRSDDVRPRPSNSHYWMI